MPLSLWKREAWNRLMSGDKSNVITENPNASSDCFKEFKDANPPKTDHVCFIFIENIIQMLYHPKKQLFYYINLILLVKNL